MLTLFLFARWRSRIRNWFDGLSKKHTLIMVASLATIVVLGAIGFSGGFNMLNIATNIASFPLMEAAVGMMGLMGVVFFVRGYRMGKETAKIQTETDTAIAETNAIVARVNVESSALLKQIKKDEIEMHNDMQQMTEQVNIMIQETRAILVASREFSRKHDQFILSIEEYVAGFSSEHRKKDYWPENPYHELLKDKLEINALKDISCAIMDEVMIDPVRAPDNKYYERKALQEFYNRGGRICPCNGSLTLSDPKTLATDQNKKLEIESLFAKYSNIAASSIPRTSSTGLFSLNATSGNEPQCNATYRGQVSP